MKRTTPTNGLSERLILTYADLAVHNLVYLTPGHAPVIVTTLGPANNVNVATFEQAMAVSYHPPRMMLAISARTDTYQNLLAGSDCVVGYPRQDGIQQAYDAGIRLPRDESELELIPNLGAFDSVVAHAPSLNTSWLSLECTLYSTMSAGDHEIVLLDVAAAVLDAAVWRPDRVERRRRLPAVYYTTAGHFFLPGNELAVRLSSVLRPFENGD